MDQTMMLISAATVAFTIVFTIWMYGENSPIKLFHPSKCIEK